ncbi:unnamed protein product [Prorocentrum cordatum]|uniref:Uncharacterized protein n=1 Tax=Prorocentrum cordatum TaxID=2364126 RepID=A0ABN9S7M1_9DINO|nr:unnamed protein product [Polarella glacialis]
MHAASTPHCSAHVFGQWMPSLTEAGRIVQVLDYISGKAVPQFWLSVVDHRKSLPSSPPLIVPMHEAGDCGRRCAWSEARGGRPSQKAAGLLRGPPAFGEALCA